MFQTIGDYRPRPLALLEGALGTVAVLFAVVLLISQQGKVPTFTIGVYQPSPHLLSVDRSSVTGTDLNTTVRPAPVPEDPWKEIAGIYFKQIRVLNALDTNGDFILTPGEIAAGPIVLRRLDLDHNGKLSAEECGFSTGDDARFSPQFIARARQAFMHGNPVLAALGSNLPPPK